MRNPEPDYSYSLSARDVLSEESSRAFMQRVYWWMSVGLALTGGIAWVVAGSQQLMAMVLPLFVPLMVVELAVVFLFSFIQTRVSGAVAGAMLLPLFHSD